MGGRDQQRPQREEWISEVSTSRLHAYERLMSSEGAGARADGSGRTALQRDYFRGLVQSELDRRKGG